MLSGLVIPTHRKKLQAWPHVYLLHEERMLLSKESNLQGLHPHRCLHVSDDAHLWLPVSPCIFISEAPAAEMLESGTALRTTGCAWVTFALTYGRNPTPGTNSGGKGCGCANVEGELVAEERRLRFEPKTTGPLDSSGKRRPPPRALACRGLE